MAGGLRSLTGVLSTEQVSELGLVRKPSKRQGEGGGRAVLVGSSRTRTSALATLRLGGAYLSGLSTTRTAVSMAVLSFAGGAANLAGISITRVNTPAAGFTPGTAPGGDMPANSFAVGPTATGDGTGRNWNNRLAWGSLTPARGRTYYLMDGTYASKTLGTAPNGTQTITIKKATAADHGTDTGWNVATMDAGEALIGRLVFNSSWWIIDGNKGSKWATAGYGIHVRHPGAGGTIELNASDVTLRLLDIEGNGGDGSAPGVSPNPGIDWNPTSHRTLVSMCYVHDTGQCPFFGASSASADIIIEHCRTGMFESVELEHAEIASIWAGSTRWTFRYNLFTYTTGTGGIMVDGTGWFFYGNVFYRAPGSVAWDGGNGAIGSWSNDEVLQTAKVFNNTFINLTIPPITPSSINLANSNNANNEVRNNLFYNTPAPDFTWWPGHSHNHFINTGGAGTDPQSSSSVGDPFVDMLNLDFRIKSTVTMPAGTALASPYNVDANGLTRTKWTRGACEQV